MDLINIKHPEERVSFREAVLRGLGRGQGLYFFEALSPLQDPDEVLGMDFLPRCVAVLGKLIGDEIETDALRRIVGSAFDFPVPCPGLRSGACPGLRSGACPGLRSGDCPGLNEDIRALELFHGPSLAFKDFGARFMARCLAHLEPGDETSPITILTATSGDTGAAVAHAYNGQSGVRAVILYPRGKVSPLQEKLFCTLGGNVTTLAVDSDFDCCQQLVKQAFDDPDLREGLRLNSANSINIARLVAQVCYYFEGAAQLVAGLSPKQARKELNELVFSVPSGNFGNLTAGLLARAIGLPYKRIIAATNVNDTVPRFLASGRWEPRPAMTTLTNAMDISQPNNFPRVLELGERHGVDLGRLLTARALSDEDTRDGLRALYQAGYLADPHSALAWSALRDDLAPGENGIFLCTAHPAKFLEVIRDTLGIEVPLPPALAEVRDKPVLSEVIPGNFAAFREKLYAL